MNQEMQRIKGHGVGGILFNLKSISLEGKPYSLNKIMEKVFCILSLLLAHLQRQEAYSSLSVISRRMP